MRAGVAPVIPGGLPNSYFVLARVASFVIILMYTKPRTGL